MTCVWSAAIASCSICADRHASCGAQREILERIIYWPPRNPPVEIAVPRYAARPRLSPSRPPPLSLFLTLALSTDFINFGGGKSSRLLQQLRRIITVRDLCARARVRAIMATVAFLRLPLIIGREIIIVMGSPRMQFRVRDHRAVTVVPHVPPAPNLRERIRGIARARANSFLVNVVKPLPNDVSRPDRTKRSPEREIRDSDSRFSSALIYRRPHRDPF